jgi:orotidine-5'-phosphate decarboxylase
MMSQIIVALDFGDAKHCIAWVEQLDPAFCALKIGSELFTSCGPQIVKQCISKGFRVFLDLKFHDIPNTVARATAAAADLGVWMLNVHAMGGSKMLAAARAAIEPLGDQRPLLIAVTVLTSDDQQSLTQFGIQRPLNEQVMVCARLAYEAGLDGVVCSGWEASAIKQALAASFLTVTPGIRLQGEQTDDQVRVLTPLEAKKQGSDYLVMGRSITRSADPSLRLKQLYQELNGD